MPVAPRLYRSYRWSPYKKVINIEEAGSGYGGAKPYTEPNRSFEDTQGVEDKHAYWATQASYGATADPKYHNKLLAAGYKLDTEPYGDRYKVYYNSKGAILANRGTVITDFQDLQADAGIAFGDYDSRGFQESYSVAKRVKAKYKNVHHTGHSLGGTKAIRNSQRMGDRATVFNPGTSALGLNAGDKKVYTSSGDIISNRVLGTNVTRTPSKQHTLSQYDAMFQ